MTFTIHIPIVTFWIWLALGVLTYAWAIIDTCLHGHFTKWWRVISSFPLVVMIWPLFMYSLFNDRQQREKLAKLALYIKKQRG